MDVNDKFSRTNRVAMEEYRKKRQFLRRFLSS